MSFAALIGTIRAAPTVLGVPDSALPPDSRASRRSASGASLTLPHREPMWPPAARRSPVLVLSQRSTDPADQYAEWAGRPYVSWSKLNYTVQVQSARGDQFRPMVLSVINGAQNLGLSGAKLLRRLCTEELRSNGIRLRRPSRQRAEPIAVDLA